MNTMNRQVVECEYKAFATFKVPIGVDLDNDKQVKKWWVRWNSLYIEFVDETLNDGEPLVISGVEDEGTYKTPTEINIGNWNDHYDEEEGEEISGCCSVCDADGKWIGSKYQTWTCEPCETIGRMRTELQRIMDISKPSNCLKITHKDMDMDEMDEDQLRLTIQEILANNMEEREILETAFKAIKNDVKPFDEANGCPVCMLNYNEIEGHNRNKYTTECDHNLCLGCFDIISDTTNKCPLCRENLIDVDEEEDEESNHSQGDTEVYEDEQVRLNEIPNPTHIGERWFNAGTDIMMIWNGVFWNNENQVEATSMEYNARINLTNQDNFNWGERCRSCGLQESDAVFTYYEQRGTANDGFFDDGCCPDCKEIIEEEEEEDDEEPIADDGGTRCSVCFRGHLSGATIGFVVYNGTEVQVAYCNLCLPALDLTDGDHIIIGNEIAPVIADEEL